MFGMAVAATLYVFRKVMEFLLSYVLPSSKTSWLWKLWNELLLPIAPVVFGVVGALLFKTYPYPDGLTTEGDRVIFGLVAGLLSTLFYRVIKALLIQKIQSALPPGTPPISTSDNVDVVNPIGDSQIIINQVKQVIKQ